MDVFSLNTMIGSIKKMHHNSFLINIKDKGFFHLFSANFLILFVGFASQIMVAWILTPVQLGQIKIMQTYLAISLLFTTFGFNSSVLKLGSEQRAKPQIIYIYKKSLKYITITLIIVLPILMISTKLGLISNDLVITKYFIYLLVALIPMTYSTIYSAYLQAIKEIKLLSKINIATKIFSVTLVIVLTYLLKFKGYLLALIISYLITFCFLYIIIQKINGKVIDEPIKNPLKTHTKIASISFLTNLIGQLSIYADVFLMNYYITDKESIGYYSFALTLIVITTIYTNTVNQISVPFLSEKSSNPSDLRRISRLYERINIAGSFVLALLMFFFIPLFIKLIFGLKYEPSIHFFKIMLFSWLLTNIVSYKGYTLFCIGKINYNLYSSIILLVINFLLSFLCLTKFGLIGLAYGKLLTSILAVFFISFIYKIGMRSYERTF